MPRIKLPNGKYAVYPDSMSQDDINTAIGLQFPPESVGNKNIVPTIQQGFDPHGTAGVLEGMRQSSELGTLANPVNWNPAQMITQLMGDKLRSMSQNLGAKVMGRDQYTEPTGYSAMGVQDEPAFNLTDPDKPFSTPEGRRQLAGMMAAPGAGMKSAGGQMAREFQGMIPEFSKAGAQSAMNAVSGELNKFGGETKGTIQKVIDTFSPAKAADKMLEYLGGGAKNAKENSIATANKLREMYDPRAEQASAHYEYPLKEADREREAGRKVGSTSRGLLYDKHDPLIKMGVQEGAGLMSMVKKHDFGEIGEAFNSEPTLRNAHKLLQEVGFRANDLRKQVNMKPPNVSQLRKELAELDNMYAQLKGDMRNYLQYRHPNQNANLLKSWEAGDKVYKEEVLPFLHDKKLRSILRPSTTGKGRKQFVGNLHKAFENPEAHDIVAPDGTVKPGEPSQLISKLPDELKNRILFGKIGASKHAGNHEKLVEAVANAENAGYDPYVLPETKAAIQSIKDKARNKDLLKSIARITGLASVPGAPIGYAIYKATEGNK